MKTYVMIVGNSSIKDFNVRNVIHITFIVHITSIVCKRK